MTCSLSRADHQHVHVARPAPDAQQVGGVVQRRQRDALLDALLHHIVDEHRLMS